MSLFVVGLVLLVFVNRYFGGLLVRRAVGHVWTQTRDDYEPDVSIVIPMFNEGRGIYDTIHSLLAQDYPADKLRVTVVDDCSTDDSFAWAKRAADEKPGRVLVLKNPCNMGKRRGIAHAVRKITSEIVVSVDSDVIVDRRAVRELVRRFTRDDVAAVGGRVHVRNANASWLTRMQTIKYFYGYEFLKNVERAFGSVMCLSGCLTAYRRDVLLELEPILENRSILGVPIKYGEDRFLTRQIVKAGYRTLLTLDAECWTVAPDTLPKYFAQQLRWRRSNAVDFFLGLSHAYRLHPLVALHYMSLFALFTAYPVVVAHHLLRGDFWPLATFHLAVLGAMGAYYAFATRNQAAESRVPALSFLAMGIVMPVTYVLFTPLALFTLDSSSWETRGHGGAPEPVSVPTGGAAAERAV